MGRKYIIEVSDEGIFKTFIDKDGKEYKEKWYRTTLGAACDTDIVAQLDQYGDYEDEDLLEVLEEEDLYEMWKYFEENN